jgi:hypothetical protein
MQVCAANGLRSPQEAVRGKAFPPNPLRARSLPQSTGGESKEGKKSLKSQRQIMTTFDYNLNFWDWVCNSVVKDLCSMHKALGSIPSITQKINLKKSLLTGF